MAGPRRLDERRDGRQGRDQRRQFRDQGYARRRASAAYAAAPTFDAFLISSISVPRRRPTAAAAAFPAAFTALPARFPRLPLLLVNPCSARAASAAVAATATSSAMSGLCSSLMKASPIPLSLERLPLPLPLPPPLLRRGTTAVGLDPLLLPPAERLLLVVFLAIARLSS